MKTYQIIFLLNIIISCITLVMSVLVSTLRMWIIWLPVQMITTSTLFGRTFYSSIAVYHLVNPLIFSLILILLNFILLIRELKKGESDTIKNQYFSILIFLASSLHFNSLITLEYWQKIYPIYEISIIVIVFTIILFILFKDYLDFNQYLLVRKFYARLKVLIANIANKIKKKKKFFIYYIDHLKFLIFFFLFLFVIYYLINTFSWWNIGPVVIILSSFLIFFSVVFIIWWVIKIKRIEPYLYHLSLSRAEAAKLIFFIYFLLSWALSDFTVILILYYGYREKYVEFTYSDHFGASVLQRLIILGLLSFIAVIIFLILYVNSFIYDDNFYKNKAIIVFDKQFELKKSRIIKLKKWFFRILLFICILLLLSWVSLIPIGRLVGEGWISSLVIQGILMCFLTIIIFSL